MELDNRIGGTHGIGQFNRRKSRDWRILWDEIIKLEDLIGANLGIVEFDRRQSWDQTI
jgi:hypothetical protein